jgi:hypothetical protein
VTGSRGDPMEHAEQRPNSQSPAGSDESRAETNGIDWYYIFLLLFLWKSKNKYRNPENKYEIKYCQKIKYDTDTTKNG